MPGVKRKASSTFATPGRPAKLAKRTTSHRVAARSTSGGDDIGSPTPALRKASTLTVEDKDAAASLTKKASSKKLSSAAKPSLVKKASSVVIEGGTVTTVVPLKSGASIGETSLTSKESLKKAESIRKSLSKTPSVTAGTSAEPASAMPLPPGGLLEVAISFDTTGSMYGVLEEVRAKVRDLAQRLQADIPGIRISVIAHGDYCDADKYIVKWIDFGSTLPELCDFVSKVESTFGGDGPECYELVLKRAREELAWTPGSQRVLVMIGDDEPHKVGYRYGGKIYNIDWKKECKELKDMGVKCYGVQSGSDSGCTRFMAEMARLTDGRHVNLSNFSSIFDFLMMICYREGNPDMLPVYTSEIRARGVGGMAKDTEALALVFGAKPAKGKAPKTKAKALSKKPVKLTTAKKATKAGKGTAKKGKKETDKGKKKKTIPKTSVKKLKGKTKKRKPKKKIGKEKKLLREKLIDAKFISGPLTKLNWSKWILAASDKRPLGYASAQFPRSKHSGFGHAFIRQRLFRDDPLTPSIYEVGVKFPDAARRKIYALYFKPVSYYPSRMKLNALTIVRSRDERKKMRGLIADKLKIFVRRGTGTKDEVKAATKYIHRNFDYAWGWKRRHARKVKLVKHGVDLS